MTNLLKKRELLRAARYDYNFDREVYVNRHDKKVFSLEFVEDNDQGTLQEKIDENNSGGWRIYFNDAPSPSVQRELEALLG